MRVPDSAQECIRWLTEVKCLALATIVLFVAHLWLVAPVLQNGDGAVYNEQIEQCTLGIRSPHVGYMVLGMVFNEILPFGTERNLNLMCLVFASFGAAAIIAIARRYGSTWLAAVFAGMLVFGIRSYLRGAVLAEVDGVACSLILIALASWVFGYRIAAGIAYGAAMLVTPLSSLSLPVFLFTSNRERTTLRNLLQHSLDLCIFGVSALAAYVPLVLCFWQDYWHGGRGLLRAPRQPWDLHEQVMRSVRFFSTPAMPWVVLGLAGILLGTTKRKSIAFGTLMAIAVAATVGERFLDVPVQLPQLCMLAVLAVLVVDRIANKKVMLCVLCVLWAMSALPSYLDERREILDKLGLVETYKEMAKQTPKLMVVGLGDSWIDGLQFERIIYHRTKLGLGLDYRQFRSSSRTISRTHRDYTIWLMSPAPTDIMNPFLKAWRKESRSIRDQAFEVWLPSES